MGNPPFSRRHGFRQRREIAVRDDAPEAFRAGLLAIPLHFGLSYSDLRGVMCAVLMSFQTKIIGVKSPTCEVRF